MTRPLNEYFKKMLSAKRSGATSFVYNGNTYVKHKTKTGLTTYKKKCNKGTTLNPVTKRCRKKCAPGQKRNKSGRCVKR